MKIYRVNVISNKYSAIAGLGWAFKINDKKYYVLTDSCKDTVNSFYIISEDESVTELYSVDTDDYKKAIEENNYLKSNKTAAYHLQQLREIIG